MLIDTILRDVPYAVHFAKDGDGIKETKLYSEEDLLAALTAAMDPALSERLEQAFVTCRPMNGSNDLDNAASAIADAIAQLAALRADAEEKAQEHIRVCNYAAELEAKMAKLRKERDDALTFLNNAVSKAPEPLKALGKYLAGRLDEDEWLTAEQDLNAAAKASQATEAKVEKLVDALRLIESTTDDSLARRIAQAALTT